MNYNFSRDGYTINGELLYTCDNANFDKFYITYNLTQRTFTFLYNHEDGSYEILMQNKNAGVLMATIKTFFTNYTTVGEKNGMSF